MLGLGKLVLDAASADVLSSSNGGLNKAPFCTRDTGLRVLRLFGTASEKEQTSFRVSQTVHLPDSPLMTQRDFRLRQESHGLIAWRGFG